MTIDAQDRALTFAERQMDTMLAALSLQLGDCLGAATFMVAALRTVARIRNRAKNPNKMDAEITRVFSESKTLVGG